MAEPRSLADGEPWVFFDLDDTLFDHSRGVYGGLAPLIRRAGRAPPPPFELVSLYSRHLDADHPDVVAGRRSVAEARCRRVRATFEDLGLPRPPGGWWELSRAYRRGYRAAQRPVAGSRALVAWLRTRRAHVGVITNNRTLEQRRKLAFCGLGSSVELLVTSQGVGVSKPSPVIFHAALARARCPPGRAVMVGDRVGSDIEGARRVGMGAVFLDRWGQRPHLPPGTVRLRGLTPAGDVGPRVLAALPKGPGKGR